MNITIPIRLSQVGFFLAGFLMSWFCFGNGPARAEQKAYDQITQQQMIKETYILVHDLYVLRMAGSSISPSIMKQLWIEQDYSYPDGSRYKPH